MLLKDLVSDFMKLERPNANILSESEVLAQLLAAAKFYAGFAGPHFESLVKNGEPDENGSTICHHHEHRKPGIGWPHETIDENTDITISEWSLIRPLFLLYVEREAALQLEASRVMGADVFGRSSSEISGEILQVESEMPHKAFWWPVITV